jgi:hypothetical protein
MSIVNLLGNDDEAVAAWWHHISLTEIRHCRVDDVRLFHPDDVTTGPGW